MRPPGPRLRRLCLWACLLPQLGWGATLRLQLVDARDGVPVAGASVVAGIPGVAASSDAQGLVVLGGLPAGELRLRVGHVAYQAVAPLVVVEEGDAAPRLLRLEPALLTLPPLVVEGRVDGDSRVLEVDAALPPALRRPAVLLERLPGLSLQQGREGGPLEARLRGARADQLAVSVDGVPLNPASGEAVDLGAIDWGRVRRVELVTDGARPGGELRLATRPPDSLQQLRGAWRAWDAGRRGVELETGGALGPDLWRLGLEGRSGRGDHPYRDEQGRERRRRNQETGSVQGRLEVARPGAGLRLQLEGRQDSQGLPGPLYQPPTPEARQEAWSLGARLSRTLSQGSTLALWGRGESRRLDSPARQWLEPEGIWVTRVPFALRSREGQAGLSLRAPLGRGQGELRLVRHEFRQEDEGRADPLEGKARRLQLALAVEGPARAADRPWRLQGSGGLEILRDDNGPRRRLHLLGHASTLLEHTRRLGPVHGAVHAGLSHSRQAPSFRPLFLAESAFSQGNPHLRPEQASALRAGLRAAAPGWPGEPVLRLEGWGRLYRDGIIWRRNYRNQYLPVNLSRSSALGLDAGLALRRGAWSLEGAATLQRLRNEDKDSPYFGRRLPFQPDGLGHLTLGWTGGAGGLQLHLALRGRSFGSESNLDPQGIAGVGLPAWRRLDLRAWRQWRPGPLAVRLSGGLDNLLDGEIETVDGYPRTGRGWSVELEVSR